MNIDISAFKIYNTHSELTEHTPAQKKLQLTRENSDWPTSKHAYIQNLLPTGILKAAPIPIAEVSTLRLLHVQKENDTWAHARLRPVNDVTGNHNIS